MKDLIVCDEDYEAYKTKIAEIDNALEERLAFIIEQLQFAYQFGFISGDFHDNLGAYIASLQSMQGQLCYFTSKINDVADGFIQKIDEIDVNLY